MKEPKLILIKNNDCVRQLRFNNNSGHDKVLQKSRKSRGES